ncbi:MAG: diguanylate cyclase [Neptuniibacter sp.]
MKVYLSTDIGRQFSLLSFVSLSGMLLLCVLFFTEFSGVYQDFRRDDSKAMTIAALALSNEFYQLSEQGLLTESEAQEASLNVLRSSVHWKEGYYWVMDDEGKMVMHPFRPDLVNMDLFDLQDANGAYFVRNILQQAEAGGGWVEYLWPKPGKDQLPYPKVAYVKGFQPWGWVIGTGLYVDEINQQRNRLMSKSAGLIVFAILLMSVVSIYYAKRSAKAFRDLVVKDPLTGLFSRRYLNETMGSFVNLDDRNENMHLYLVFMDIDFFKKINDRFGHGFGDQVLKSVGKVLLENTRGQDICVRYGGEEFVILVLDSSSESVLSMVERIRKNVNELEFENELDLTLSAGVAKRDHDETFSAVLKRADNNLYDAKQKGRDRVVMT